MKRRGFLGALAGGASLVGCQAVQGNVVGAVAEPPPKPAGPAGSEEWARVRAEFELSTDWIYMAGFLLASHPRRVRDAIAAHRRALDDNPALYLEGKIMDHGGVLGSAAKYMAVEPSEIALTDSTTMGLGTLYAGFSLKPEDEVLTTTHDHYSTHESLRLACEKSGAALRKVALYQAPSQASAAGMTRALKDAISPRTRLVAVTWVHSSSGVKIPVRQMSEAIAKINSTRAADAAIVLCVDGVHGFGVENVSMADLGCDFFVAGTHKWLFGPRGTGLIWGKAERWPLLRPTIPHFGRAAYQAWMKGVPPPPTTADMMTPGGFHSFEHRWAVAEAFEFHLQIGKDKVEKRIHELNRQCKEGLAKMKHVTLHTPLSDEISAGIIAFEVSGMAPETVVERLHEKRIVASKSPYAVSYPRLSPSLLNSAQEVERSLAEVQALA